jgi:Na+/proline symporter
VTLPLLLQTKPLPPVSQPAVVAVAVGYFVIVAGIAVWAARRTRSARDFYLAGDGIGVWTLAVAAMASTLSGFAFIGGPGLVYATGMGAMFLVLSASVTTPMSAWVLGKRMRLLAVARDVLTVPDAIGARYRSRAAQGLAAVALLAGVLGYVATNVLALGLVIDAIFGVGLGPAVWLGALVVVGYTATGGILAGVYTDLFQGALMAVVSALVFGYALASGGGLEGISRTLLAAEPALLAPWGRMTPLAALSLFFLFGVGVLGQPHVAHKYYMLREPRRLKWYPVLMTGALLAGLLLYFGVGMAAKAAVLRGDLAPLATPDDATPVFLLRFTPVLLGALVFAGIAAAVMSTVNSFLNLAAAAVTHDLPVAAGRRLANELAWGRLATVALAVLAALLARHAGVLVAFLGIFGYGLFAATFVPSLAIGLNWPGATRAGAIASIATGLVVTLTLEALGWLRIYRFPAGVSAAGLALVASLLVFLVVSWLTADRAAADLDDDVRVVMEV